MCNLAASEHVCSAGLSKRWESAFGLPAKSVWLLRLLSMSGWLSGLKAHEISITTIVWVTSKSWRTPANK